MHVFYVRDINSEIITFDQTESKHCIKVLRLKEGDEVYIVDGIGGLYKARLFDTHLKCCSAIVFEKYIGYGKRDYHLHIGIAPTKNNERFEWFAEKATEIGVDEITPVHCTHSERKVVNTQRVEKIITAAVKQSVRAYHPRINPIMNFSNFVLDNYAESKFIAHCGEGITEHLMNLYQPKKNVLILIGPEGDFTESEVSFAIKNGYAPVSLGNNRLRTETAGVVACHIINLINDSISAKHNFKKTPE